MSLTTKLMCTETRETERFTRKDRTSSPVETQLSLQNVSCLEQTITNHVRRPQLSEMKTRGIERKKKEKKKKGTTGNW